MNHCKVFEAFEDELFQQLNIMGLALRNAKKTTSGRYKDIHLDCGIKASDRVDAILERIRNEKEIACSVACTSGGIDVAGVCGEFDDSKV